MGGVKGGSPRSATSLIDSLLKLVTRDGLARKTWPILRWVDKCCEQPIALAIGRSPTQTLDLGPGSGRPASC